MPGLILIPTAADQITIPMIASGGFGDGRGLAAALALGADGINMGTRFMATAEAPVHDAIKQAIVSGSATSTQLIFRTLRNTARVADNSVSREVVEILGGGGQFADIRDLVAGAAAARLRAWRSRGGIWYAGMSQGLINDMPTVAELMTRIVTEAEAIITGRLARFIGLASAVPVSR